MIDDVTRRLVEREALLLGPLVTDAMAEAVDRAQRRHAEHEAFPHYVAMGRRVEFRLALTRGGLPGQWVVSGNSRQSAQTILLEPKQGISLRVLSESSVTSNGVPHAGRTQAQREAWGLSRPLDGFELLDEPVSPQRDFLLLCNFRGDLSARIVRPIAPGRFKGSVACDYQMKLTDAGVDVSAFAGDEQQHDLFAVDVEEELGDA